MLDSFSKYILRAKSKSVKSKQLTEKVVALLVDRHADVIKIPRQFQAELLDELSVMSKSKVDFCLRLNVIFN